MSLPQNLLLLGKVRPERKRSLNGMAAAAKMVLVAIEEPADALTWLESNDVTCVIVDATTPKLDKVIAKLRARPNSVHAPVFALVQSPDELWVEQYFGWGGDDMVPVDAGSSLLERLKSVLREAPKVNPARRVLIADPESARCEALSRVFAQAGCTVQTAMDRSRLEQLASDEPPAVVIANAALGEMPELISRLRKNRKSSGWVLLAARRELEAQQAALSALERCVVIGLQSSSWQLLYRANDVARTGGVERRAAPRYFVGNSVLFRAAGSDEDDIGVCYNLSQGGMFIRTYAPFTAEQVWLEWRIPGDKTRVRLEGEVVWQKNARNPSEGVSSPLGFGVKFADYLGAAKGHLNRALEALEQGNKKSLGSVPNASVVSVPGLPVKPLSPQTPNVLPSQKATQSSGVKGEGAPVAKPAISPLATTVKAPSMPPRPAGTVVATSPKPDLNARGSRLPKPPEPRKIPKIGAEQLLDEGEGPTSSDSTDVVDNPLFALEAEDSLPESLPHFTLDASSRVAQDESLPHFTLDASSRVAQGESLPHFTLDDSSSVAQAEASNLESTFDNISLVSAPDSLSEFSLEDAPTVITKAPSELVQSFVPADDPTTTPFQPTPPRASRVAGETRDLRHDTWDDSTVAKRPNRAVGWGLGLLSVALIAGAGVYFSQSGSKGKAPLTQNPTPLASLVAAQRTTSVSPQEPSKESPATASSEVAPPTVSPDPGGDLPGYPPIEEQQAGKGRLLADKYGYLIVRFPEAAFIFSENIAIGPVNSKIAITCGTKTLRIGVGEKPTTYLSEPAEVQIACRETTRVIFRRLPGVVVPPGAMRPLPIAATVGEGKERVKVEEPKTALPAPSASVDSRSGEKTSGEKAVPIPSETAPFADEGVVDSRE